MGVFSRLATLIKSNINDLISRAEDPEKILNQLVVDMREQAVEAKKQVAKAIADEKLLKKQLENELHKARHWEEQAMKAVRAGRDELAMEALNRKEQHEQLAEEYRKQHELQQHAAEHLKVAIRQLNSKIEEASRKRNLLVARQRRAEAQQKIQETMRGFGDTSAFDAFDRMSEKVDQIEANAEAQAELSNEMGDGALEDKFRDIETAAGANDALAALKRKMGVAVAAPARPAPAAVVTAPAEVEEEEFDFEALEKELAAVPAARSKS